MMGFLRQIKIQFFSGKNWLFQYNQRVFYNSQTNCYFIDFYVILERAYRFAIDELLELGLIELENTLINFKNVNVRRVFQHHIIHQVCEEIIHNKSEGIKVIYYSLPLSGESLYLGDMGEYEPRLLENLLTNVLGDMVRHFPIIFYSGGRTKIRDFHGIISQSDTGEAKYHLNTVLSVVNSFDATYYRYDKIRDITKRRKLSFLSEEYFSQFKSKKLAYQH